MEHKGTVYMETERLILRRFVPDDFEPMYENCWREWDVCRWTSYAPMNTLAEVKTNADMFTESWLGAYERPNRYSWAIVLKETGEPIGRLFGMHPSDRAKDVELAYEMGSRWWNNGLMTEAVKRALTFFFEDVGMERVYAYHASANPASGRVMQKCGMKYEGTMRMACVCNGGRFDQVNYGMLKSDYYTKEAQSMSEIVRRNLNSEQADEYAYSEIVEAGDFVFLTFGVGNIGQDVEAQINGALDNLEARLRLIGLDLSAVVKVDVLLRDPWNIPAMEKVFKERFKGHYPARKTIATEFAHKGGETGLQAQIDAIAYKK